MAKLTVEDQWLRKALQEAAGKKTFSEEDLAEITELDWSEYRAEAGEPWGAIEDIEPLKACTALKILSFDGNHISDLSPLANCAQLEEVWLVSSAVSDLTPLSTCRKLRILNLDSNYQLEDITPLRGLPALTQLMLSSTRVRDITPLLDLPALKDVSLYSLFRLEPGSEAFKVMAELLRRGVKVGHEDIEIVQASVREGQDAPAAGASLVERLKALSAFEVARAIESFGLNGQGDDGDQKTPLHLAVRWDDFSADPVTDRLAVVRELLAEPGIVVDSLNRLEETPLTAYLKHNRRADAAMARLLLDAGADPNARSHWGDMPLRSAIEAECPAVVDVLIERGAKWLDPSIVNTFASKGMLERVRAALEAGYDVNSKDENSGNSTLLHMAAFGGRLWGLFRRRAERDCAGGAGPHPERFADPPQRTQAGGGLLRQRGGGGVFCFFGAGGVGCGPGDGDLRPAGGHAGGHAGRPGEARNPAPRGGDHRRGRGGHLLFPVKRANAGHAA